jgi:hypothetical protein
MRSIRGVAALAVAVCTLASIAAAARTGPAGTWTQIAHAHNGAAPNLGLARAKDGTLHVFWAGPARAPYSTIFDTPVSPAGNVGRPHAVVSGWNSVQPPAAATAPDGSIHVLISGQKVVSTADPFSGLNEAVGPGSWRLGPRAFGHYQLTVASAAQVATATLRNGQLVSAWRSANALLFQAGVDPATQPVDITPPGLADDTVIAVDQASGDAYVAYEHVASRQAFYRRVLPSLAAPQRLSQGKIPGPQLAARAGGGVYSAYAPGGNRVVLVRLGGQPRAVPVPKGVEVLSAGLAAGPDGRLWVFYGNAQQTFVTRTSKAVGGFEPVQAFRSPPGSVQYFRLEGEGSAGPLDLFADVTIDGGSKDGSYATHVLPMLSLAVAKKALKNASGRTTGFRVTVRVLDAGDPVEGATVAGLPGGSKRTDAHGSVVVTSGKSGTLAVTASKAGYVSAKGRA